MRGLPVGDCQFLYNFDMESRIPKHHPLRRIRRAVDQVIERMNAEIDKAYSDVGRPSIPPEHLIKASLLQVLFSIRSERLLCEMIEYNFLYRWFLGLSPEEPIWNHSTFTHNRDRFAEHGLLRRFFDETTTLLLLKEAAGNEQFSVDGTLVKAWGSMKSVQPKADASDPGDPPAPAPDGSPVVDAPPSSTPASPSGKGTLGDSNRWNSFKGKKRSNATHESTTDPEARLARKSDGAGSILAHSLHALMSNRDGVVLDVVVTEANGRAERDAAEVMLDRIKEVHDITPATLGADKGYDAGPFLDRLEKRGITPHVAIRRGEIKAEDSAGKARRRAMERCETPEHKASQRDRRRIEPVFAWLKHVAGLEKINLRGRWKIQDFAYVAGAAFNLVRGTPRLAFD